MLSRRWILPLSLLFGAACSDGTAPSAPSPAEPHFLRWAASAPPRFAAIGARAGGFGDGGGGLLFSPADSTPPVIAAYRASFWAVRGEARTIRLDYQTTSGSYPFLQFTATDPTYVPGRGELAQGDSVLITVRVDSQVVAMEFQPSGLQFGTPAVLTVWYGGAGGDLNGDGLVNEIDSRIEAQLLGMWYRDHASSSWTPIPATQSLAEKWFTTSVPHFSDYAVSW